MVKEREREREREKERKCTVKSSKAPKKMMKKKVKREGKPTKKIFIKYILLDHAAKCAALLGNCGYGYLFKGLLPISFKCMGGIWSNSKFSGLLSVPTSNYDLLPYGHAEAYLIPKRIPPHFMKHLMKDTSNRATLKCSSSRFWNIELRPAIGSMYLQDGWQQFLKDNSLGDREFLLFRYDGNMCFNVQIFEKNGCERVGMSVTGKHQEFAVAEGKRKRGRPRKIPLGSTPLKSCGDGPGQSHLQLQSEKFEKVKEGKSILREIKDKGKDKIDLSFQEEDSEVKKFKDDKNFQRKTRTGLHLPILKIDSHTRPCSLERLPPAEEVEEEEDTVGFQRVAESFTSGFPYFQRRLKRACVDKVFILTIPTSFSRAHLQNIKTRMALRNLQGETWEVNCIPTGGKHYLCGGWAAFVRGNNLKTANNLQKSSVATLPLVSVAIMILQSPELKLSLCCCISTNNYNQLMVMELNLADTIINPICLVQCTITPIKDDSTKDDAGHSVGACLVIVFCSKASNRQTMEKESLKTEDARPHFFKIIHGEDVKRHLRIPPAFMKHLSQEMSNRATLTGPSGSQWRVTVSTDANGTYLQKGWKQFMKENNLGDSEFLTFRYDGNMQFYVKIFDKSGVQRLAALVSGNRTQEGTRVSNGKRAQGRPRKSPVGSLNLHKLQLHNSEEGSGGSSGIVKTDGSFTSKSPPTS
ncbi:hypothetical protein AAG906_037685 [Vitis piasezkii]